MHPIRPARLAAAPLLAVLPLLVVLSLLAPAAAAQEGDAATAGDAGARAPRTVALVLYDGVEVLDFAGPAEVFQAAGGFVVAERPAFELYTVARSAEPITSQGFLEVVPDHTYAEAPLPDVLVLPGGGTGAVRSDPAFMAWLGRAAEHAEVVMSVCTGAFILGDLGLLDERRATTWYAAVPRLAESFPRTDVRPGMRLVDNGEVVTTAGVSAGIDGALHLVARLHGRHVADLTARYMEYDWSPEAYLARDYPWLDPGLDEAGRTLQLAEITAEGGDHRTAAAAFRRVLDAGENPRARYGLAASLLERGDLEGALAAFAAIPADAGRYAQRAAYNGACVAARLGNVERSLELLARAVDAGFRSRAWAEADEDLAPLRDDPRFAALLARME